MFDRLRDVMVRKFQLEAPEVVLDATLKDLELDSLDVVELSLAIEKELGVSVSDDELLQAADIRSVVALLENRTARV
ncbi:acyl carrier protein [Salinispora cortesiana]|uniref:acyl carrier protein n=1 Tax=Salinispora cortesiana TaxID=1305843 RepID=UPI000427C78E|nr:acyl carrier protein [Salinispora cortesiana]